MRAGKPIPRPPGVLTPCAKCAKIPDDKPKSRDHAIEPTTQTRRTLTHWFECRAVGVYPDDPIVRRNAAIIRRVHDEYERHTNPAVGLLRVLLAKIELMNSFSRIR